MVRGRQAVRRPSPTAKSAPVSALSYTRPDDHQACFHAQQAAEKALEAVLYGSGERQVLGHSVTQLSETVERLVPAYGSPSAEAAKLDRYYIPTRYPNGLPLGTDPSNAFDRADATAAIATAEEVVTRAGAFLSREESE